MLSTTYLHDCKTVMDSIYILRDAALGRGASKLQHISEVEILNRVPDAQHNKDHWDAQQPHLNRLEPQTLHLNLWVKSRLSMHTVCACDCMNVSHVCMLDVQVCICMCMHRPRKNKPRSCTQEWRCVVVNSLKGSLHELLLLLVLVIKLWFLLLIQYRIGHRSSPESCGVKGHHLLPFLPGQPTC